MDSTSKKRIKELAKNEQYDEIYREFGRKAYKKYVSDKYYDEDLKKLKKEGRYEDIYNKYGESEYNKLLIKSMYNEIKQEKGTIKANLWRMKQKLLYTAKVIGFDFAFSALALSAVGNIKNDVIIGNNAIKYESEIEEYNEKNSEYADKINSMNLSDTQIFMKTMDDMWKNIKGYANPEKDIKGFLELDLTTEEGYGVCRNMASDVAKKLNAINPEYNARTMAVYMSESGEYQIADIKRNVIETNNTVTDQEQQANEDSTEIVSIAMGNHMITMVDIVKYNITLVLDPTNPGIGIYKDGKITMLNSDKANDREYKAKEYINTTFNGAKMGDTVKDYFSTYRTPNISDDEIEKLFGLEAQNKALAEVRAMDTETAMASKDKENDFLESIKVDVNTKYELEKSSEVTQNEEKSTEIEDNGLEQ